MKCPRCNEVIDEVAVVSECWQRAQLKGKTNKIESYGSVEEIERTLRIECPLCSADITGKVKE